MKRNKFAKIFWLKDICTVSKHKHFGHRHKRQNKCNLNSDIAGKKERKTLCFSPKKKMQKGLSLFSLLLVNTQAHGEKDHSCEFGKVLLYLLSRSYITYYTEDKGPQ